jgi:hypothetical protein
MERKSWAEFRDAGLLWWVNRGLHLFGWAIVLDDTTGTVEVYPARVKWRGFSLETEDEGFQALTAYLKGNAESL